MKKLSYLLFLFLNILLTPITPILFVFFITILMALNRASNNEFILKDKLLIFIFSVFLLLFYISRIFIFPLIYKFGKSNEYISNFFEKINKHRSFRNKVLLFSFLADIITIFLFLIEEFFTQNSNFLQVFIICFLIGGGGLTLSYLSLIIWFKTKIIK